MIFFSIEDLFYKKIILDCLAQFDPRIVSADKLKSFCEVILLIEDKKIKIIFDGEDIQLKSPCVPHDLYKSIINLVNEQTIDIQTIKYYPFKQELVSSINQGNSIKLNFISNNILNYLLQDNTGGGISKTELYNKIWPQDKTISPNKLDTHLTNTKNLIKENFNVDLKLQTTKGHIRLMY